MKGPPTLPVNHAATTARDELNYIKAKHNKLCSVVKMVNMWKRLNRCENATLEDAMWPEIKAKKKIENNAIKPNAMNATLSQNVVVTTYNEVPPTNITERVQLKYLDRCPRLVSHLDT